ncbi:hypothetical protein MMC12_000169 [Toensbergia leucococca]|nr:hypothetical protein [Toensbergia leucococca]
MDSAKPFLDATKARRSLYQLSAESPISDARIEEIVNHSVLHTPGPFNAQSGRVVVLLKKDHVKLWDFTMEILKAMLPAEKFEQSAPRLEGFRAGYGTILFYEDPAPLKTLATQWAMFADKFPQWSEQSSGMLQYAVWTALELEGLGCNLQHYNPLVDSRIQSEWKVPTEWSLKGQLVFGKPSGQPKEKTFQPLEERVKVYGRQASL